MKRQCGVRGGEKEETEMRKLQEGGRERQELDGGREKKEEK